MGFRELMRSGSLIMPQSIPPSDVSQVSLNLSASDADFTGTLEATSDLGPEQVDDHPDGQHAPACDGRPLPIVSLNVPPLPVGSPPLSRVPPPSKSRSKHIPMKRRLSKAWDGLKGFFRRRPGGTA